MNYDLPTLLIRGEKMLLRGKQQKIKGGERLVGIFLQVMFCIFPKIAVLSALEK